MIMFSYECFAITHIGSRRRNNEDNFFIGNGAILSLDEQQSMSQAENKIVRKSTYMDGILNRIIAVSDGMGGHKHGEVASRMVVEAVSSFSQQNQMRAFNRRQDKFGFIQSFQNMVYQTNEKILDCAGGDFEADIMGATLTGLILFADEAAAFNIGDSSTFLYENHVVRKLTTDDNEAERFKDIDVTLLEANGKRLTKYFGMPRSCGTLTARISQPVPLRPEQIYIIASDGLTDYFSLDDLSAMITGGECNPSIVSEQLVEGALNKENGGRDNITVVVLKVH